MGRPFSGSLFAEDFLRDAIRELDDWHTIGDADLEELETHLRARFDALPANANENQTENDLIWPVLQRLGWTAWLRQQNLSARGREDVPDGVLYHDSGAKQQANAVAEEWKRYEHGRALVESKRWNRPLDRRSGQPGEESAPSTQILRYLRRVDDQTNGRLRWGILTNGARWRLYHAGARSVSEQFFEIDLAAILDRPGHNEGLFAIPDEDRRHWLRVFALVFRQQAFGPVEDRHTLHRRALDRGRHYRERVAADLSGLVFGQVFPNLARALAAAAPDAPLPEVRDAALVLLYRLLFLLYAEDRDLLPVSDPDYGGYAFRRKVREDIGRRKDENAGFSKAATHYWQEFHYLCCAIDGGDASIGLPPYNGGLFDRNRTPLLSTVRLDDAVMADAIDALSFEQTPGGRRYINYRNLGVQQLGSIYERLLEREIVLEEGEVVVRPDVFARKDSGSFYTPDELVSLVVEETLDPLVQQRLDAFREAATEGSSSLEAFDPAERLLELKICDPAMGSGHFLVNLVDYLTDRVLAAMAETEEIGDGYVSPLNERIAAIRQTIVENAGKRGWTVDSGQLDDRHIVRRMVLKRCVYGVDKNPMAVELAKVSLWLHTFTVGAPLGFLDHHLRCGDSLFGSWAEPIIRNPDARLLLSQPLRQAAAAAAPMREIEGLTDAEIAEAQRSAETFARVSRQTAPLDACLSLFHALGWLDRPERNDRRSWLVGAFGNPIDIAQGADPDRTHPHGPRFKALLQRARELVESERFLNWQVAFPGVWPNREAGERRGGFDAVIGNPPWERMKLQQVEWFAARRPAIARAARAADRKRMIAKLTKANDPLAQDFATASRHAETRTRMARRSGDYPQLSGGDLNLYSLFVERAMTLARPDGMVGLLVPSGIASDKTASRFFKSVATEGRLKALYDFENRRPRYGQPPFFPDVDTRFKFCTFIGSPNRHFASAQCAFFLQDVSELEDPERRFPMNARDFARVNPNTGTAPIFRTRRDAAITTAIYDRLPVLVDRSEREVIRTWPVKYVTMFHMANDSHRFRTRAELEENEGAWPVGGNRYDSPSGAWVPLYEGKMVQAFDHRAADIAVRPKNLFRTGQPNSIENSRKINPDRVPEPRYWVQLDSDRWNWSDSWVVSFKDITASTNIRTMIAAICPHVGAGHTLPLLPIRDSETRRASLACFISANLNSIIFDYVARHKVPTTHFTWFVLEQLPVVPPDRYREVRFGPKTAAEIVLEAVLELTYVAHDMAPFARELGHLGKNGEVLPPFPWDETRRLHLRAKLDALYFHLYGVTDRDDIRYIYSTFPIVEREERKTWGDYRSRDLCLAWMNSLAAGEPDAGIEW